MGGLRFAPAKVEKPAKTPKPKREKVKNDPKVVAAARELRDRWMEQLSADPTKQIGQGKYNVAKAIVASEPPPQPAMLPAA